MRTHVTRLRAAWSRPAGTSAESGAALVTVVGAMLILAMFATVALAVSVQGTQFARRSQDYTAAMTAAQSAIEDLIARLNRDDHYADTVDCGNPALQRPMTTANPCGWTSATPVGWLPVDSSQTDPDAAHFHYELDATLRESEGTVMVVATGRVNGVYRSIETAVGMGGSTDYVYYTDFESGDPSNIHMYPPGGNTRVQALSTGGAANRECGRYGYEQALHWWQGRSAHRCAEITFGDDDELEGAVFSNDSVWGALSSGDGPLFKDGFQSANPACETVTASPSTWAKCLRQGPSVNYGYSGGTVAYTSEANFNGKRPRYHGLHYLDDNTAEFQDFPGCRYYGSTRIVFNSNGTMTVWNKTSNNGGKQPTATPGPLGTPSCGSLANLDSAAGATVPVPHQMVVYVDVSPASEKMMCNSGELGGPSGRTLPIGNYNRTTHKPTSSSSPSFQYDVVMAEKVRYCQEGNLYVEGVLDGRVSLAAAQSIIVTGDLVRAGGDGGDDILGLVATNSVEVMHPMRATFTSQRLRPNCGATTSGSLAWQYCPGSETEVHDWPTRYRDPGAGNAYNPSSGIQIAGSIQTLQHSFFVQKYGDISHQGTLYVRGSIAQRWRGAVGTSGGNGYDKLYVYDDNLVYGPPPYFPRWMNAQWALRYSGEIDTPAHVRGT